MIALFVNHKRSQCGVYEFGRNIGAALERSAFAFSYHECASADELLSVVGQERPDLIVYNHHPATMGWVNIGLTRRIGLPQIGIIHEVSQAIADTVDNRLFNFHIAHDPTLLLKNPIVFKAGRLIPHYENKFIQPEIPVIGTFGFAGKKGQRRLVELVQKEFDTAIVRINIPFATFGDRDGRMAKSIADECRAAVAKPNIELEITHDFLPESGLLDFIAQNTANFFLYEAMDDDHRGISAVVDLALAVNRPLGITNQKMFRHIVGASPGICVEDSSIREIIANGVEPLEPFRREWTEETLCWDYERIVSDVLSRPVIPRIADPRTLRARAGRFVRRTLGIPSPAARAVWIGDPSIEATWRKPLKQPAYASALLPEDWSLNCILDDRARDVYAGTVDQMFNYLPDLMKRKIPEANVQQAFVLDTVYKIVSTIERPRMLCVGSFEDSAAAALKLLGFQIDDVDPMINYDLATFLTKPSIEPASYDVVFSTSVIEHVEDDEEFLAQIGSLVKIGGTAVLTCDYNDKYRAGDPKPIVDCRLYTKEDLEVRLGKVLSDFEWADEPQWDCPDPDFWYEGVNYTFATMVLRKRSE